MRMRCAAAVPRLNRLAHFRTKQLQFHAGWVQLRCCLAAGVQVAAVPGGMCRFSVVVVAG